MNQLSNTTRIGLGVAVVVVGLLAMRSCSSEKGPATHVRSRNELSVKDLADMLQSDFQKLDNLADGFTLRLRPPEVLLDSRQSKDGKDVLVNVSQSTNNPVAPWNVLEVISGNANLRSLGVRTGDTIKLYMFPDGQTRLRLQETGQVDGQMVNHEPTDLVVAQVLADNKVQVVEGVVAPRNLMVHIPEEDFADVFNKTPAEMDLIRATGKIDAQGVRLPASQLPLVALPDLQGSVAWPPRIEVWRVRDDRIKAIDRALASYVKQGEPPVGWEPSPDAEPLGALTESFNRWLRSRTTDQQAPAPELIESLPQELREDKLLVESLSDETLNRTELSKHEGRMLQEATWCRDIGRWSAGSEFDPLPRARKMFDWVVRNVTLTDSPRVLYNRPWQTLVYGQGTVSQRAWVFAELCRQQRIACCVLSIPIEGAQEPWLWCGIIDHEKLYLFDPQLGLELGDGQRVVTLAEATTDDALLRAFDLEDSKYPVTAELAKQATPYVVAEPFSISSRAQQLQKQQSGETALKLYVDTAAESGKLTASPAIQSTKLWPYPLDNLRRTLLLASRSSTPAEITRKVAASDFYPFARVPRMWKARLLHFRGVVETQSQAKKKGVLHDPTHDHRAAAQLYLDKRVRLSSRVMKELEGRPQLQGVYQSIKVDATYWLALLQFDMGAPRLTAQWLEGDVMSQPNAKRRGDGVRYNLARAYESLDKTDKAIALLRADESPQRHGNRLRAARLEKN